MEIKLITGATAYEAAVNTLKQIDVANLEQQNLVVVPDSFSMQAESLIFDVLKIKSTFNIEVVGISRLAGKILRQSNIAFERVGALEEIFCVFKAVKMCEDKFLYFKKCGVDFCTKILQIIKQFKACKIQPDKIKEVGNELLDNKMHDLKLVYLRYDELLGDKLDLSKFLEFFVENAKRCENLSKINLFFINFDSFSLEINSFICQLSNYVNKVFIGMAKPLSLSQGNAFIYEDDIFKKTTKLAKEFSINVQVQSYPTSLTAERLEIVQNLYSFQINSSPSNYFLNVLAKDRQDEISYVVKEIKDAVVKGARFRDFAVAVADKKYFEEIKEVFSFYGISLYCDDTVNLSQTVLGRFLLKLLEISKLGFDKQKLEYIVSSPLFANEENEKILSEMDYYNVEDVEEFLQRYPQYEKVVNQIALLSNQANVSAFCEVLSTLLELVKEKHETILEQLQERNNFKKQSENLQAVELLSKVLEKLKTLGQEEVLTISDFESLFKLALNSVKVETIPSYIDAVYVGDVTESYFEDVSTLFVLGATANALPKKQNDTGIIDDDDIQKLRLNFVLEPEIKVINRRNRLKLFEVLQHAQEKLVVCLPIEEDGRQSQKADFVLDLIKIFGNNVLHTSALDVFDVGLFSSEESFGRLMKYIGCRENLLESYTKLKAQEKLPHALIGSLQAVLKTELPVEDKKRNISCGAYRRNVISASQLETYFSCPYKHFLQYCLKIKQKENIEPDKRKFGIFEHSLLRLFVETYGENVERVDDKQLDSFLKENLLKLAQQVYDEKVLHRDAFVRFLKNESKVILKNVVREQKNSEFKPLYLEKRVSVSFGEDFKFEGVVDRVDKSGEVFRVLDYKTGRTNNVKTELYYGKKLQLFLYSNCIQKMSGLKLGGMYYFDCQIKYSKADKTQKLLNGLTLKCDEIVEAVDRRLKDENFKSDLLGMQRKKTDKDGYSFRYGNVTEDFNSLLKYAEAVSNKAVEEIKDGYIEDKPFVDDCKFCPFISICRHRETYRDTFKEKGKSSEDEN